MVHDYHLHRHDPPFLRARLAGIRGILDWYGRRVDSTGMLEVIMFLEETFGIKVGDDEMVPENLDSVDRIAAFVRRKKD